MAGGLILPSPINVNLSLRKETIPRMPLSALITELGGIVFICPSVRGLSSGEHNPSGCWGPGASRGYRAVFRRRPLGVRLTLTVSLKWPSIKPRLLGISLCKHFESTFPEGSLQMAVGAAYTISSESPHL